MRLCHNVKDKAIQVLVWVCVNCWNLLRSNRGAPKILPRVPDWFALGLMSGVLKKRSYILCLHTSLHAKLKVKCTEFDIFDIISQIFILTVMHSQKHTPFQPPADGGHLLPE